MKKLSFYFVTDNSYSQPVTEHDFILRCVPQDLPEQRLQYLRLYVKPVPKGGNYGYDSFGNRTYTGRLPEEHRSFNYSVRGLAERDDSRQEKSGQPIPGFYYPSVLTRPSDSLYALLASIRKEEDDLAQAEAFRMAIHRYMTYTPGATNVHTTAGEAAAKRAGVCQDYAHIFLALCRMRHIPCRYVNGLPVGEGASHAWCEVWYRGRWYGIDPTRNCDVTESYLKLCTGRDFSDCPIEQGVFWGACSQSQTVYTKVEDVTE